MNDVSSADSRNEFKLSLIDRDTGLSEVSIELPESGESASTELTNPSQAAGSLSNLSNSWTSSAIGFFETVPFIAYAGHFYANHEMKETLIKYASSVAISEKELDEGETRGIQFVLNLRDLGVIDQKMGRSLHAQEGALAMGRATLGALLSEYEAFLFQFLKIVAEIQPDVFLSGSEKNYSLDDLAKFGTMDEFRKVTLERKITDILQKESHKGLLDWLEGKFDVNLHSNAKMIREFIEICQRRHLLVHSGGVVTRKYLEICRESGFKEEDLPKLGERLRVGRKYLRRATARIYQVGFFTLHMIWQKLVPNDCERSLGRILTASHDFLDADLTKMARRVADFGLATRAPLSNERMTFLSINKAQGYLFDDAFASKEKEKLIEKTLNACDLSMTTPLVDLAISCLRREHDNIDRLTQSAKAAGLSYSWAFTWCIFREVRELPEFRRHFT